MGCCSSQTQAASTYANDSGPAEIGSEPESITANETKFFNVISDDSTMHCISFLNPYDFVNVCCTCKNFRSLTSLSNNFTQEYWKQQCISLCTDVVSAIQHNNFNTQNWFSLFMDIQGVICSEKLLEEIVYRRCTLMEVYTHNSNLDDENTILPITLMNFTDGTTFTHIVFRYTNILYIIPICI